MTTLYSRELPSMLRVADVAAYLNISTKLAYRLVKQPRFPLVPLSNNPTATVVEHTASITASSTFGHSA